MPTSSGTKNHHREGLYVFHSGACGPPPLARMASRLVRRTRSTVRIMRKRMAPVVKRKVKTEMTMGAQD